jgi:hypothetical protein
LRALWDEFVCKIQDHYVDVEKRDSLICSPSTATREYWFFLHLITIAAAVIAAATGKYKMLYLYSMSV